MGLISPFPSEIMLHSFCTRDSVEYVSAAVEEPKRVLLCLHGPFGPLGNSRGPAFPELPVYTLVRG